MTAPLEGSPPTPIRLLHVDDDADFASLTAEMLTRHDERLTVDSCHSVGDALEYLAENGDALDCIVSDYDMAELTGLDLLRAVRNRDSDLPFILFTGKGSEEIASEAISNGVSDYLQKRGGVETYAILANRIRNLVERNHAQNESERNQRFLAKILERTTDIVATSDLTGNVRFVSGSVESILGYQREEIEGKDAFELVHSDDREAVEANFHRRLERGDDPVQIRFRGRRADGDYVDMLGRAYNLADDPDVGGMIIYSRLADVEEQAA